MVPDAYAAGYEEDAEVLLYKDTLQMQKLRKMWAQCPMRGRRLPELCAGGLFPLLEGFLGQVLGKIRATLDPQLPAPSLMKLLEIFEQGRSFIIYNFTLKLCTLMEPPHLVGAVAHPDKEKHSMRFGGY